MISTKWEAMAFPFSTKQILKFSIKMANKTLKLILCYILLTQQILFMLSACIQAIVSH